MEKLKIIDLFCGVGGFSYGFEMSQKFETILGVDNWDKALETFKANHPQTNLINGDITSITSEFWQAYKNQVDVIIAGPPCQGFSMAGKREIGDQRNSLFEEVVKITKIVQPKYIVIENVVGLLSMTNSEGQDIKELIVTSFENIGYRVKYQILNAAEYGVPQARKRVIFLISKDYSLEFPLPIFDKDNFVTVGDALGNVDQDGDEYLENETEYQKLMSGTKKIHNHERRKSNDIVTGRMSYIPQGGNWCNIPPHLGTGGGTHSNAYKRLDTTKPSITIKHAAKAMIIHPQKNRILTIREVARLQSFNDDFIFKGSVTDQHQQLANAVPPLLGNAIGEQIYKNLQVKKDNNKFTFIDLFAGIGGFRLALEKNGGECVFSSEIDKHACQTYSENFNEVPKGDITKIHENDIPDHDILCAGFPCQPFSVAGKRKGFEESRGTLFFEIARILKAKKPKAFILENVKGLINHDNGDTLKTIEKILDELGYQFKQLLLNSKDFGVPQSRERWYCIGVRKDLNIDISKFEISKNDESKITLENVIESKVSSDYQITETCKLNLQKNILDKFSKITPTTLAYEIRPSRSQFKFDGIAPTLTAKMGTGGNNVPVLVSQERKLTERECLRIMGFPESFKIKKGYQSYKQIGNSIVVPVMEMIAKNLFNLLS